MKVKNLPYVIIIRWWYNYTFSFYSRIILYRSPCTLLPVCRSRFNYTDQENMTIIRTWSLRKFIKLF